MLIFDPASIEVDLSSLDPFDPTNWDMLCPEPKAVDTYYISLSDRIDCHAIVDYQDYLWARELKWCHTYGSGEFYECAPGVFASARPDHIYARNCAGGTTTWLHREILLRACGKPRRASMIGDHKNGKTLDCRRINLRWATRSQNSRNIPGSRTRSRFLKQMGAQ